MVKHIREEGGHVKELWKQIKCHMCPLVHPALLTGGARRPLPHTPAEEGGAQSRDPHLLLEHAHVQQLGHY